jgi:hypothetical protein
MKKNQLTRGEKRRVMYVENKDGDIDGVPGRIGWVTFSQSGRSVYYRGRMLKRAKGGGISGNFYDEATGQEYWISGVKKAGSNQHWPSQHTYKLTPTRSKNTSASKQDMPDSSALNPATRR